MWLGGAWLKGSWIHVPLCAEGTYQIRAQVRPLLQVGAGFIYFLFAHEKIHKMQRSAWLGKRLVCCAPWHCSTEEHDLALGLHSGPRWMRYAALSSMFKASFITREELWGWRSQLRCVVCCSATKSSVWFTCEEIWQITVSVGIQSSPFASVASTELLVWVKMLYLRKGCRTGQRN